MNAGIARTTKDTPRAEAQRERILCAAQRCFIEYGFHAASMASIAETAQMSAGLMYRYFENKSAIVLAIIERQLQEGRTQIAQLHSSSELAAALYDVFTRWQARDPSVMNAALFLEMSAEATRDPQIAAALCRSDALILSDLAGWMNRAREDGGLGLPPETVATRAFLLECFIRGLALTAVRQPDLPPGTIKDAIDSVVSRLLSP
jgi:AcrR family transcriptional regulator